MIKFRNKNKNSVNDKIHELSINQLKMKKDIDKLKKENVNQNYFYLRSSVIDNSIDEIDIDNLLIIG